MSSQDALRDLILEQVEDLETTTELLIHRASDAGMEARDTIADNLDEIRDVVAATAGSRSATPSAAGYPDPSLSG
jgi:hypothetical protein